MHILVVNDDGPPNDSCSPYIFSFVTALSAAGHAVSVVLPDQPQSWISKAHLVGKGPTARPFIPDPLDSRSGHPTGASSSTALQGEAEWTLVNGTPASCTQLGLFHLTTHRGPVDLVVSGPNWGRNASTLYNLASGTVGGAMEAAQCGKKAIAISFASKKPQPAHLIQEACDVSVALITRLHQKWDPEVELYTLNVPMLPGVASTKVVHTQSLPVYWTQGSLFQETEEAKANGFSDGRHMREFRWEPQLQDVQTAIDKSVEGTDGWALSRGFISVTPMITTFKSVDRLHGTTMF